MKNYTHYENFTSADVKHIATSYNLSDIFDYAMSKGDSLPEDFETWWNASKTDEQKVSLFLDVQKYPSIAMAELDVYLALNASYDEYRDMSDPCLDDDMRHEILADMNNSSYAILAHNLMNLIEERELDIHDLPKTASTIELLISLIG